MEESEVPVEIVVETAITAEIERLSAELTRSRDFAFEVEGRLAEQDDAAFKSRDPIDRLAADKTREQLAQVELHSAALDERLQQLRQPSEFEARVAKAEQDRTRKPSTGGYRKMPKENAKDQGFPDVYLAENGNFRTGMDARAKSDLINSALGLITKENPGAALYVFEEDEAMELIKKREWESFYERKQEIVEAREKEKAANAEKREAEARERAAAKEKKDAEKAAAKEAKEAEKAAAKAEADAKKEAEREAAGEDGSSGKSSGKSGGSSKTDQARAQREAKAEEAAAAAAAKG